MDEVNLSLRCLRGHRLDIVSHDAAMGSKGGALGRAGNSREGSKIQRYGFYFSGGGRVAVGNVAGRGPRPGDVDGMAANRAQCSADQQRLTGRWQWDAMAGKRTPLYPADVPNGATRGTGPSHAALAAVLRDYHRRSRARTALPTRLGSQPKMGACRVHTRIGDPANTLGGLQVRNP